METQYVHQVHYGMHETHSLRPQFMIKGNSVYATSYNKTMPSGKPLYDVRGGKWYATSYHPDGAALHASFEAHDGTVHATAFHPHYEPGKHIFTIDSHPH